MINARLVAAARAGDLRAVLSVIDTNLEDMNLVNCATGFHRLAKLIGWAPGKLPELLGSEGHEVLLSLLAATARGMDRAAVAGKDHMSSSRCQTASNVAWSLASIGLPDEDVLRSLIRLAESLWDLFDAEEFVRLVLALSRLALLSPEADRIVAPFCCMGGEWLFEKLGALKTGDLVALGASPYVAQHFGQRVLEAMARHLAQKRHLPRDTGQFSGLVRNLRAAGVFHDRLQTRLAFQAKRYEVLTDCEECAPHHRATGAPTWGTRIRNLTWLAETHPRSPEGAREFLRAAGNLAGGLPEARPAARLTIAREVVECLGIAYGSVDYAMHASVSALFKRRTPAVCEVFDLLKFVRDELDEIAPRAGELSDSALSWALTALVGCIQPCLYTTRFTRRLAMLASEAAVRRCRMESDVLICMARQLLRLPGSCIEAQALVLCEAVGRAGRLTQAQRGCLPALAQAACKIHQGR